MDWRAGAAHFYDWLVDGDVASNVGNWQWVAGNGADTRPNRVFNPIQQAKRFDPDGNVCAPVCSGARRDRRSRGAPAVEARRAPPRRLPGPDVEHHGAAARFRRQRRA